MQRQNFFSSIRFSRVLTLGLLLIMLGGLLKSEAAAQPVSFGARADFGTGNNSYSVAVGDFNGDGTPDLAVANENSNTVSILLGTGTGSFGAKTDFGTGLDPRSVAVGDFNGDGKLDLVVANDGSNLVSILLGTGTGSFGAKTDFGTGVRPNSVAVGDFNGDGKLDLAVANIVSSLVSILLGTGTGSFGAKTDFGTGSNPRSVAVGDFNGDGKLDLAVANFGGSSNTVSILLGLGTGSFGAKTDFGTGSAPFSVAVGDFNGDGKLDLAVANRDSNNVSILPGTGTGSFGAKTDFGTGSLPFSVAVGDFNDDGKLDLAVANGGGNSVSILPGLGTGSFGARSDFGTGSLPISVAVGDFNGDGKPDLAVANFNSATVSILLNTTPIVSAGVFCPRTDFSTDRSPESVAVGDFNGDGKLDLTVANRNSASVSILPGTGTGSFGAKNDFGTGIQPVSVAVGDFNGDGKLDLAVANFGSNAVSILLGTGTGSFGAKTDFGTGSGPRSVAVGDFNGDGKLDLAVVHGNGSLSILPGTGTGSFGAKTDFGAGSTPVSVAVGDFNSDGKLDLAVANLQSDTVSILLGTGTGSFGAKTDFGTGSSPNSVAVGDFNGDGKLDLAVVNGNGSVSILLGTGTGSFGAKTDFGTGAFPFSVAVGDFNGDGKLDLAVANQGSDTVSILLGTGTGSFGAKTDFGTGESPISVAVGDFNGDGKLDLAVANFDGDTVSALLNNCTANTAPTLTPLAVTRTAGSPSANSQIATAMDAEDAANVLRIQISNGGPFGDAATVNGVTVTLTDQNAGAPNVNPDAMGKVFADVVAACGAMNANFTLRVTDIGGLMTDTPFTVTVNPNTPPVLSYTTQTVTAGTTPMFNPATGPSDNVAVTSIALQSVTPMTGLTLSVNNATGQVTVMSASVAGSYTVVIRATDNCAPGAGTFTDATFTVNVSCLTITLSALPNGTGGSFYDQTVTASPAGGSYTFMQTGGSLPPGLTFNGSTGQLSGTPTLAGTFNFTIKPTGIGACMQSQNYAVTIACPTITLPALPAATAGAPYSQTLTASPAGGNYIFMLVSGSLPPNLMLAANGSITGTPTTTGVYNFSVQVTGFGTCMTTLPVTLAVGCPPITLSPATLPNATVNTAYAQAITASPADGGYTFALTSGSLPAGLMLLGSGSFGGAPAQSGVFNFRVLATGFGSCTSFRDYVLIVDCPGITVNPANLPGGAVGTLYSQSVSAMPAGSYSFAVSSGALPAGLTLNASSGVITGTPTTTGSFNFTITATAGGCSGSRTYPVTIACPAITLNPGSPLPSRQAGAAYSQTISVSPAAPTGSYTFSLLSGSLPSGLTMNPATGVISGLPSTVGSFTFTVKAQTAGGCSGTQTYTLAIVCPAVTLSPASMPGGATGVAYSQTVSASPGGGYSYAVTTGTLPAGLNLNPATGVLSGTPATAGSFTFRVTATGFGGCTGFRDYTIVIGGGGCPTITLPASLPNGSVGQLYNAYAVASPSGSYTYSATGSLPPGITLYTSIGLIFGYPTTPGSYTFTIAATAGACSGNKTYTVLIGAGFASSLTVFSDFDGDGKSDLSVFRGTDGNWLVANSGNGQVQSTAWGASYDPYNDVTVSGDYDGDGKTDLAVFRRGGGQAGYWYIKQSRDGQVIRQHWGLGTDIPVPGDYDGDGKTDIAVWRGSAGAWYILRSSDSGVEGISWGIASVGDIPVPGDYDGDFKTDVAVFRRGIQPGQGGDWHIKRSSDGLTISAKWGVGTDVAVPGDYDGDGKTDLAVWRASEGNWYVIESSSARLQTVTLGVQGDVPALADYDGDGKADAAVWRASSGMWTVKRSSDGAETSKTLGQSGDVPIVARRN